MTSNNKNNNIPLFSTTLQLRDVITILTIFVTVGTALFVYGVRVRNLETRYDTIHSEMQKMNKIISDVIVKENSYSTRLTQIEFQLKNLQILTNNLYNNHQDMNEAIIILEQKKDQLDNEIIDIKDRIKVLQNR